ncbi:hypothetical protein GIY30_09740 [Gordonia sp. HNM0687]|uniref:Uncharacterized protein n=1 Tax=Gordonia mangrovi TaxID=2665643 RepID=A0A6L7GSY0_9ACTN|nr:hypothetical protein [Gordonia mangrovi]MXP21628.1 hypothetical protein [Gordonia mangrovi]UVF80368.1 hypothetical protein NWF22_11335 [Gordonia mangrovi]
MSSASNAAELIEACSSRIAVALDTTEAGDFRPVGHRVGDPDTEMR